MKKRLEKNIGILLCVLMMVTMLPMLPVSAGTTESEDPFQDVQEADWFFDAVLYVYENGWMSGTAESFFAPQSAMSRAMLVTVLYRMEGESAAEALDFRDVPDNTWFTDAVAWAAANGVVNGYNETTFGPFDDVTREQMVTILFRYAEKKGCDVSGRGDLNRYRDKDAVSDWAKESVAWANSESLIRGYSENTLVPGGTVTRAEAAAVFMRFCENTGNTIAETIHTVTFDYNYDCQGVFNTVEVKDGKTVGTIENPSRPGYIFLGWFREREKDETFDANKAVTEDLTLYAHWKKNPTGSGVVTRPVTKSYTVSFITDGGSDVHEQVVEKGKTAVRPDDPARNDDEFVDWYSDSECTAVYDFDSVITGDVVLYAKWREQDPNRSFTDSLIARMPEDQNWVISPYSLEMCLAMVANGAKGTTQKELLDVLQIDDLEEYNAEVRQLLETYEGFNRIMSLETANSIWINQDRFQGRGAFLDSFRNTLDLNYLAEAREVRDDNSVEEINAWADRKTHGKISHILDEDNRQFAAALANAVYFKAAWGNKFSSAMTRQKTFYNQDGTENETLFMHQLNDFPYYESEDLQVVALPYQNYTVDETDWMKVQRFPGADFSMYLLKSKDESGENGAVEIREDLDLQNILDHAEFQREKVRLTIPKFKMEYGDSLVNELRSLGISAVFDPAQADLSGMIDLTDFSGMNPLYLDDVVQKAYLAIDEEGTEAAAVTVAIVKDGSAFDPKIYEFTADHPFYFVIRDNTSGLILFAGKYNFAV